MEQAHEAARVLEGKDEAGRGAVCDADAMLHRPRGHTGQAGVWWGQNCARATEGSGAAEVAEARWPVRTGPESCWGGLGVP